MTAPTEQHVRIATRDLPGALQPAQVQPYCGRCNVGWPCPTAAAAGAQAEPPPPSGYTSAPARVQREG